MRAVLRWLLVLGIGLVGCKEEEPTSPGEGVHDAGPGEHEADAAEFEGCPDHIPAFEAGMTTLGSQKRIAAVLREASAMPPERYFNDWTLEFTDAEGAPLEDVEVLRARAYMRVHDHYGTPDPSVAQREAEPALFDLERINLFMRGPWEVQLVLRSESAGEDDVVVDVCVEE